MFHAHKLFHILLGYTLIATQSTLFAAPPIFKSIPTNTHNRCGAITSLLFNMRQFTECLIAHKNEILKALQIKATNQASNFEENLKIWQKDTDLSKPHKKDASEFEPLINAYVFLAEEIKKKNGNYNELSDLTLALPKGTPAQQYFNEFYNVFGIPSAPEQLEFFLSMLTWAPGPCNELLDHSEATQQYTMLTMTKDPSAIPSIDLKKIFFPAPISSSSIPMIIYAT